MFWQMRPYGSQAVAVFFVLSGFVIGHVTQQREHDAAAYFINRCARLYSVVIPAVVVIVIFDGISMVLGPNVVYPFLRHQPLWLTVPATLTFLNEAWHAQLHVGSGGPLWSLSFEVAYYVAFGALVFARGWYRVILPLAVLALMGPLAIAMAPLWLFGVGLQRFSSHISGGRWGGLIFTAGVAGWTCYEIGARTFGRLELGPVIRQSLAEDYLVGAFFAATVLGVAAYPAPFRRTLGRGASAIRWLAGATFTIYLLHFPAMLLIASVLGSARFTLLGQATVLLGSVIICFLVAEFSERRKKVWLNMIRHLLRTLTIPHRGRQSLSAVLD